MAEKSPVIYEVQGISKRYGSVVALEDVDFKVAAGEVVGLVGDNGAGKSTLVKVLSGAFKPDSGKIFVEGEERTWESPREVLEVGIETLYQDSGLAPNLTVSQNVFLGREKMVGGVLGAMGFLAKKKMDDAAHKDLEAAGIAVPESNRSVSQLSGGQRQAVAIGRAVAWARKVIILDEPTNHLGARQASEVLQIIRAAKAKGLGVVLISHTLPHVLEVTDRIVVLRLGKVVKEAPTSEFTGDSLVGTITGSITLTSLEGD